jgi:ubiquinone/menaquinone biosynthesis C-methylase UbiE
MMKEKTDAASYEKIADNIFAPIYPVIARQILDNCDVRNGVCIDIGAGTGLLGLAIAGVRPAMEIILYDASKDMLERARTRLQNRPSVSTRNGTAESILLEDSSVDLAVSRGSVFFWDDQAKGFDEIYRILKPGGYAHIGGGFGTVALLRQIQQQMKNSNPEWEKKRRYRLQQNDARHFESVMSATKIPEYKIIDKEEGLWITFWK